MRTLHLITHTHWDREWYQTFQQFRMRLVHMVDGLLDILESDSQYRHFMLDGQTIVLEDYLEIRPEREADLRRYIQNGRVLVGPWYLLPDEFLVSPEATIRNLLEGDRIARRFGPKMKVGYIPDPFGHIGQMPQILQGFGIDNASLWRGVDDQPNEFWWQSPDGSRVLMGYLRQGYGNAESILNGGADGFVAAAQSLRDALAPHTQGNDLLIMFGTDHKEANPRTASVVAYSEGKLDGDRIVHSTLPEYFLRVRSGMDLDTLPVVSGELRSSRYAPMLPGVLSARMWIKQRNHAVETLLEKWAEPFSAWAQAYGGHDAANGALRHPAAVLHQAWRQLMQCHPHDSICGCSIDQVHDEMRPRFDQAEQMGEEITRQSLELLASVITTQSAHTDSEPGVSIVIFNPTGAARTDVVTVSGVEAPTGSEEFELVDEQGNAVAYQIAGSGEGESFSAKVDRKDMLGLVRMFGDGAVMGMKIRDVQIVQNGSEVSINMHYSQTGEANLATWEQSRQELDRFLNDPEIARYNVSLSPVASSTVLFSPAEVPGLGYRTYWVRGTNGEQKEPETINPAARALMPVAARLASSPTGQKLLRRMMPDPTSKPPYKIENTFLVVEAQPDGTLEVTDRQSGVVYNGQNRFVDGGDRGDEYNYSPPATDRLESARLKSVRVERGEVQQILTLSLEIETPEALEEDRQARSQKTVTTTITTRITLTAGVPRVDIHTEIENLARDHRLRVHFKAPFPAVEAEYDGHFEVVRRPVGTPAFDESWSEHPRPEVPQRAFTCVTNDQSGLLVANRGLPEAQVLAGDGGAEIAVTLLRCVGWLSRDDFPERKESHAGPGMATPGAQMSGKWAFDYAVIPYAAPQKLAAFHQAYAFEAPLRGVVTSIHAGSLPDKGQFLAVEPQNFIISAVKSSEDGFGWLARGYNLSDEPFTVSMETIQPFAAAEKVNLAEAYMSAIKKIGTQSVSLEIRGHEVASVAFRDK